jgi:hypothetical protein
MINGNADQGLDVRSVLLWQVVSVVVIALLALTFSAPWLGILFGGLGVMFSTWHVHRSVQLSGEDKVALLKAAGLRFVLFMLFVAVGVVFLKLHPLALIAGMAIAYMAMYMRSFTMMYKKMRGDGLG